MSVADWTWHGHPGHFVGRDRCRFRLCTSVGGDSYRPHRFVVSTVGEWYSVSNGTSEPDELGHGRTYETAVFRITGHEADGCPISGDDCEDMEGYTSPGDAHMGHYAMCHRWESRT